MDEATIEEEPSALAIDFSSAFPTIKGEGTCNVIASSEEKEVIEMQASEDASNSSDAKLSTGSSSDCHFVQKFNACYSSSIDSLLTTCTDDSDDDSSNCNNAHITSSGNAQTFSVSSCSELEKEESNHGENHSSSTDNLIKKKNAMILELS